MRWLSTLREMELRDSPLPERRWVKSSMIPASPPPWPLPLVRMLRTCSVKGSPWLDTWKDAKINQAKEILAFELTKMVHGEEEAVKAQAAAKALFVGGGDGDMPTTEISPEQLTDGQIGILSLMVACKLASSNKEARTLVTQGGVLVNDEKVPAPTFMVTEAMLKEGVKIRKGKKVFHKAILK